MAECEANYIKSQAAAIQTPIDIHHVASCAEPTSWIYGKVKSKVALPTGVTLCVAGGEYVLQRGGKNYPTCVEYGDQGTACTKKDMVCAGDTGNAGFAGEQSAAITAALTRNNLMHPNCPGVPCTPFNSYWKGMFTANGISAKDADNMCYQSNGNVVFVEQDQVFNTCVQFGTKNSDRCDTGRAICSGNTVDGFQTIGWPKQVALTLAAAINSGNNYLHPQCPLGIC